MSFEKKFCPSPWFHMRINNSGTYEYCRWAETSGTGFVNQQENIKVQSPQEYFHNSLAPLRKQILNGQLPRSCRDCISMEQHGKVSGRQKQLLKVGVRESWFEKTLASSPMKPAFDYSLHNNGHSQQTVVDWQIDLGNYCNGACIFCNPSSSSRLAVEWKQLNLIKEIPPASWCDDPVLLDRFISTLIKSPKLQYLHFIGGETLITPAFKTILTALVDSDQAKDITIGFTTNLNTWDDSVIDLLKSFKQINLGLSIETLTPINDYVRWPCKQERTMQLLESWIAVGQRYNWLIQLRVTPTCLTIHEIDTVYEYAWQHNLSVESCNFLREPEFLTIDTLPLTYRQQAISRLNNWLLDKTTEFDQQVINVRNPNFIRQQIVEDAQSYIDYLKHAPDNSHRLTDLVQYLQKLESSRQNKIIDYIPEYEELLRSAGY